VSGIELSDKIAAIRIIRQSAHGSLGFERKPFQLAGAGLFSTGEGEGEEELVNGEVSGGSSCISTASPSMDLSKLAQLESRSALTRNVSKPIARIITRREPDEEIILSSFLSFFHLTPASSASFCTYRRWISGAS
jgi:hypothetical protein